MNGALRMIRNQVAYQTLDARALDLDVERGATAYCLEGETKAGTENDRSRLVGQIIVGKY